MVLRMLVAVAHEGGIERHAMSHPLEASPSGEVVVPQQRSTSHQIGIGLIRFRQDLWPGLKAVCLKDERIEVLIAREIRLWFVVEDRLESEREASAPERQMGHMVLGGPQLRRPSGRQFGCWQLLVKGNLGSVRLTQKV